MKRTRLARAVFSLAVVGAMGVGLGGCGRRGIGGAGEAGIGWGTAPGTGMPAEQLMNPSLTAPKLAGGHVRKSYDTFPGTRSVARPDELTNRLQMGLFGQHWAGSLDDRQSVQGPQAKQAQPGQQPQQGQPPQQGGAQQQQPPKQ